MRFPTRLSLPTLLDIDPAAAGRANADPAVELRLFARNGQGTRNETRASRSRSGPTPTRWGRSPTFMS